MTSNFSPAQSQKAEDCPISFILDDQSASGGGTPIEVKFFIRPEDMTRQYPSRMSVNQTLGGAWIDSFGQGLESTSVSGVLGWRTGPDGKDGGARLKEMKKVVYDKWHKLREEAIGRGESPNNVRMVYVDTLNSYVRYVAIQSFEIRRNKSRPLLASYRISFIGVDSPENPLFGLNFGSAKVSQADPSGFGLSSLTASLKSIQGYATSAKAFINSQILAPVTNFMNMSHQLLSTVQSTIQAGLSVAVPLINLARAVAQTGLNVFRTLAAIAGIPGQVRATLMQVASAYSNIFCVLRNALKTPKTYENYGGLYGASNCSSTFGGAPPSQYANVNPFFSVAPASTTGTGVSTEATGAMNSVIKSDVVLSPMSVQQIGTNLTTINAGISLK